MHSLYNTLERAMRNSEIEVLEIKNYGLKSGDAYLSDYKILTLMLAAQDSGANIRMLTGKDAIKEKGYVSLHLKIKGPSGNISEIQFRGELIDQLSEVDHLFYDVIQGKPLAKHLKDNKRIKQISNTMSSLSSREKVIYTKYLQSYFKYLRQVELGNVLQKQPLFPIELKRFNNLRVKNIWFELQPYYKNKNYMKNLFDY